MDDSSSLTIFASIFLYLICGLDKHMLIKLLGRYLGSTHLTSLAASTDALAEDSVCCLTFSKKN